MKLLIEVYADPDVDVVARVKELLADEFGSASVSVSR